MSWLASEYSNMDNPSLWSLVMHYLDSKEVTKLAQTNRATRVASISQAVWQCQCASFKQGMFVDDWLHSVHTLLPSQYVDEWNSIHPNSPLHKDVVAGNNAAVKLGQTLSDALVAPILQPVSGVLGSIGVQLGAFAPPLRPMQPLVQDDITQIVINGPLSGNWQVWFKSLHCWPQLCLSLFGLAPSSVKCPKNRIVSDIRRVEGNWQFISSDGIVWEISDDPSTQESSSQDAHSSGISSVGSDVTEADCEGNVGHVLWDGVSGGSCSCFVGPNATMSIVDADEPVVQWLVAPENSTQMDTVDIQGGDSGKASNYSTKIMRRKLLRPEADPIVTCSASYSCTVAIGEENGRILLWHRVWGAMHGENIRPGFYDLFKPSGSAVELQGIKWNGEARLAGGRAVLSMSFFSCGEYLAVGGTEGILAVVSVGQQFRDCHMEAVTTVIHNDKSMGSCLFVDGSGDTIVAAFEAGIAFVFEVAQDDSFSWKAVSKLRTEAGSLPAAVKIFASCCLLADESGAVQAFDLLHKQQLWSMSIGIGRSVVEFGCSADSVCMALDDGNAIIWELSRSLAAIPEVSHNVENNTESRASSQPSLPVTNDDILSNTSMDDRELSPTAHVAKKISFTETDT